MNRTLPLLVALLSGALPAAAQSRLDNMRDLGGHRTRDGATVKKGLVFRAGALHGLTSPDRERIEGLGLKCVCDLRGAGERRAKPDWRPEGVDDRNFDVMADSDRDALGALGKAMRDPKNAKAEDVLAAYSKVYRGLVTKPGACKAYGGLFNSIAAGNTPALLHCSSGKDRVGWGSAALLALLGVPRETILEDYLASNRTELHANREAMNAFVEAGGDPAIPPMIFGVKAPYLEAAFAEMEAKHGTIEKYFADALGVDAEAQKRIREAMLEKP